MIKPILTNALEIKSKQAKTIAKNLPEYIWAGSVLPKLEVKGAEPYKYSSPTQLIEKLPAPENVGQKIDFFAF